MENAIDGLHEYLKQIGEYEIFTPKEEKDAFEKYKAGDSAIKDEIVRRNLKLVVSIAKKYKYNGIPFIDLIQEGNMGLITAIDKFDPSKGFKFSTYATYWIRQSIVKAIISKGREIRLPAHMNDRLSKIKKAYARLADAYKREPTTAEIAAELGLEVNEVQDLLDISQKVISLDTPVGDGDDSTLIDFVENYRFEAPADRVAKNDLKEQLLSVMDSLEDREKEVLIKRYGLLNGEPMTLEEVGKSMDLSRERIRQIEEKALRKMRNPIRSEKLKAYMADLAA